MISLFKYTVKDILFLVFGIVNVGNSTVHVAKREENHGEGGNGGDCFDTLPEEAVIVPAISFPTIVA